MQFIFKDLSSWMSKTVNGMMIPVSEDLSLFSRRSLSVLFAVL